MYETKNMPITPVSAPNYYLLKPDDADITSAIWIFVPGEELDFSKFSKICTLYLGAYKPRDVIAEDLEPYTIPSFAGIFPNLTQLYVKHWDLSEPCFIGGITDIPESVMQVTIDRTYIADLSPILSRGTNMISLIVKYNMIPISMSRPLPENLQVFTLYRTIVSDDLIFSNKILNILLDESKIQMIHGLEHNDDISMVSLYIYDSITPYSITPYNKYMLSLDEPSKSVLKIKHIVRVNNEKIYSDFGSIPKRIIVPEHAHMDELNPIITAMNLASNYPRRMSEFVAYIPTILANSNDNINYDNQDYHEWENMVNNPDFEENNDDEDDEDHYHGDY